MTSRLLALPRLTVLVLFAAGTGATAQAHEFRAGASLTYAKNISRTSFEPTEKDATVFAAEGAFNHMWQLAPNWSLLGSAEGAVEKVGDFSGLDRMSAGVRATLRRKFGLGPRVPVLDAGVALTGIAFRESGRSGWRPEAFAKLSQRITDIWRVAATASWESHSAPHATFDTHAHRLGLETTVELSPRWQVAGGASLMRGQLVANALGSVWNTAITGGFGPEIFDYYTSVPSETSGTFGPTWVAYRVDCDAEFWWGEISLALGDRTRIPFRWETVEVVNRVGVRYVSDFWSLGVLHRF